jgi:hypothetical protein
MEMPGSMSDENVALKAEVASLKLHNESLEIRLAAANDKIASLQQFYEGETVMRRKAEADLDGVTNFVATTLKTLELTRNELGKVCKAWNHCQNMAEMYRSELLRRGADDPRKSKPPCDTAFAALQVVCKHWDREECFADLRKQRSENLRRIAALESGRELKMGTVMRALEEDTEHPTGTLLYALRNMREQLSWIFESEAELNDKPHDQWFEPPLSLFIERVDEDMEVIEIDHEPPIVVETILTRRFGRD